jgi:DNA-binding transcriptional MerR regulator
MKTTSEVVSEVGIPRQKLYYLEQKAFVKPETERRGEKTFRFYPDREVEKIRAIWKYLRIAYEIDGIEHGAWLGKFTTETQRTQGRISDFGLRISDLLRADFSSAEELWRKSLK